jgi:hypothetical protein
MHQSRTGRGELSAGMGAIFIERADMARPKAGAGFTITQLESMLESKRDQLGALSKERHRILKQLATIDDKVRRLGGTVRGGMGGGRGSRARNGKSLVGTMEEILAKAGKPLAVGDIVEAVLATGYRSNSVNFRAIVNQSLIKERKRFTNTGRGMYQLKK